MKGTLLTKEDNKPESVPIKLNKSKDKIEQIADYVSDKS